MPRSRSGAVSRRRLRAALRKLRAQHEMTQKEVADALHWSSTKLMRIEVGKVGVSYTDLQALLNHYGVTDPARVQELSALATAQKDEPSISARYRDVLSPDFAEFLEHEKDASIIRNYQPAIIPGPLQTREYARATFRTGASQDLADTVRDRIIDARLERTDLLTDADGPKSFFLIDEAAMLRIGGTLSEDAELIAGQFEHLKELGRHPGITIQVVPLAIGLYPSLRAPLVILEFDDEYDDGLVYRESVLDDLIIRDDVEYIFASIERFQSLEKKATPPEALDAVLARLLERTKNMPSLLS